MPQYFSTGAALKDKRLRDFLNTVESHLHVSKEKQILVSEIRKTAIEIQYIEDKIAIGRTKLQNTEKASSEPEARLREAEQELSRIRKERESAESEYEKLREIERDIEGKQAVLPDMIVQIAHVRGDVSKLSAKLKALQSSHQESLAKQETLEKEMGELKTRSSALENEIPVMRNTRDVLIGILPEGFDADTFDEIQDQGEIEKAINDYISEVNGLMESLEKERSDLNTVIAEKDTQQKSLLSKKEDLEEKIKDLTEEVGGEVEIEAVLDEVKRLRDEKERLGAECEAMMKERDQLESSIKSIDDELEQGKKLERELTERYTYLASRKQEMDRFDDIDAQIQRLHEEMQKCDMDSNVNDKLIEITSEIKEDIGLMNKKLQSALEDYGKIFGELYNLFEQ